MTTGDIPTLTRLSESQHHIPAQDEDIRGRKVTDRSGNELGKVGDLVIDEAENKVRFLVVEHGGFLGIGDKEAYIPVDAVAGLDEDHVRIDRTRDQVADAPRYDPELSDQREQYDQLYTHYGYVPFWGPGYVVPRYPYFH